MTGDADDAETMEVAFLKPYYTIHGSLYDDLLKDKKKDKKKKRRSWQPVVSDDDSSDDDAAGNSDYFTNPYIVPTLRGPFQEKKSVVMPSFLTLDWFFKQLHDAAAANMRERSQEQAQSQQQHTGGKEDANESEDERGNDDEDESDREADDPIA